MYISTHKHLISFQNFFGFYQRFAVARIERRFLISSVSSGNIMLCAEHHVAHKPQVEWAHHNVCAWGWGKGKQTCHCTTYKHIPSFSKIKVMLMQHTQSAALRYPLCNYKTFLFRSFMLMN
jgi:hypothetical protein